MALPSSGSSISFDQIQTEFGGSNPISMNEYGDKIGLTVGTTSTHSINSFFGLSASIHDTTFKPKYSTQTSFIPGIGSITVTYSGFGESTSSSGTFPGGVATDDTFPNSGTFSDGTTTHSANGVTIKAFTSFGADTTNAATIFLKMKTTGGGSSGGGNIANGGWTSVEAYANTTGTGTPLLTLNRTDATYSSSDSLGNSSWQWTAPSPATFSAFFGTNTSLPGSATHFFRLV